jgi:membrane protease YdiL (CAAX protease family)
LLQGGLQRLADPPEAEQPWRPVSFWPLIGASAIFAFMHFGQGAAPIPLFFLSLGLGYLYRQTGNLTACVVVHMVLNSLTLLVEILKAHS